VNHHGPCLLKPVTKDLHLVSFPTVPSNSVSPPLDPLLSPSASYPSANYKAPAYWICIILYVVLVFYYIRYNYFLLYFAIHITTSPAVPQLSPTVDLLYVSNIKKR